MPNSGGVFDYLGILSYQVEVYKSVQIFWAKFISLEDK